MKCRSAISTAGIAGVTGRPNDGQLDRLRLGSESQNLPAYMVLSDPGRPSGRWHAQLVERFSLPSLYQGTVPAAPGAAYPQPRSARRISRAICRSKTSNSLRELNRRHLRLHPGEGGPWNARIASYELAARDGRTAAKEALDISKEPEHIRRLYGIDHDPDAPPTARAGLIARPAGGTRRALRAVVPRRPALGQRTTAFAKHFPISVAEPTGRRLPLVTDLKQRGLLGSTIVHWGGEDWPAAGVRGKK